MSLTINKVMTTKDGGTVVSGSYVEFDTMFYAGRTKYDVLLKIWRSEQDRLNGFDTLNNIIDITNQFLSFQLTLTDYNSLTPEMVHFKVKVALEDMLGEGTVVIN